MNREEYLEWIKTLKVGDPVAVEESTYGSLRINLTRITKITPKGGVRVKYNENYLFKDGYTNSGGQWSSTSYRIQQITPEILAELKRKSQIDKIQALTPQQWKNIDAGIVEQIYKLIFKDSD